MQNSLRITLTKCEVPYTKRHSRSSFHGDGHKEQPNRSRRQTSSEHCAPNLTDLFLLVLEKLLGLPRILASRTSSAPSASPSTVRSAHVAAGWFDDEPSSEWTSTGAFFYTRVVLGTVTVPVSLTTGVGRQIPISTLSSRLTQGSPHNWYTFCGGGCKSIVCLY